MAYKYSTGPTVTGDLKAQDDAQRDTLIDFGEDQIEFQTSGSTRLKVDNNGAQITGSLVITGSSDIPFAVYNAGDTSPLFMIDASSSWDGAPRITIRQANDHGREDTAFPSSLTNTDSAYRGVFHIEREMGENDYDSAVEEVMPLISAYAMGDGTQAGTNADGADALVRLISWGGTSVLQMYASVDTYDATSVGGKRPLSGQDLGQLEFGGYASNQGPRTAAKLYVQATETWNYTSRNGTRYIFEACRTNSGVNSNYGYGQIGRFSHNEGWNAIAPPLSIAETGSMVAGTTINGDNFASYMFASDHANNRMVMVINDESGSIQEMKLPYTIGEDLASLSSSVAALEATASNHESRLSAEEQISNALVQAAASSNGGDEFLTTLKQLLGL